MKVVKAATEEPKKPTVRLGEVEPGEVFHFAYDTFEDALKADLFFMKLDTQGVETGPNIVAFPSGRLFKRDKEHPVLRYDAKLSVTE